MIKLISSDNIYLSIYLVIHVYLSIYLTFIIVIAGYANSSVFRFQSFFVASVY